jgi:UDP-glucose 4-epimerase
MRSYNIGLGHSYSVRQICGAVEKVIGKSVPVRMAGRRPGDPPVLWASPQRIMQELAWRPERSSLEQIISSAWQWTTQRKKPHHDTAKT